MRKLVVVIMLLSVVMSLFPVVGQAASVAPKLYLNGKQLITKEEPRIYNSSTLVPVRVVAEGLGYNVTWSQADKRVDINDVSTAIALTVDNQIATVNGNEVSLETSAKIFNNVTLVPIRFVAESLGLQVYFDQPTMAVHLYKAVTSPEEPSTGTDPGSNGSDGSETNLPADVQGIVKAVQFDGMSSVTIDYDGVIKPNKAFTLTSPDRIVVDLPNAAFATDLTPGKVVVDSHESLTQVRYAVGPDKSTTLRIVLDLKSPTNYTVKEETGRIRIDVLNLTGPSTPPVVTPPAGGGSTTPPANKVYKVVIDAGHGGKDPGASSASGLLEKTFNLSVTLKVKALLDKESKIQATYTRANDTFIELGDRVKIANDLKADAFVSIHANSYTATSTGTETYYYRAESKPFAQIMHKYLSKATGLKDNGVRSGNFKVIRETTMPAILLESGYLSNASDTKVLFDDATQNRIAQAIVSGIKEQLKL